MLPVVAITGRPNVGKSTLFNCLTRSRDALVADRPGITRDRQFGIGMIAGHRFVVIDTGGFEGSSDDSDEISRLVSEQVSRAVAESDVVLLLVDAREGLNPADERIASRLRRTAARLVLVANKVDGLDEDVATSEFHALGLGRPWPISTAHRRGLRVLMEEILGRVPRDDPAPAAADPTSPSIRVAVIGRPNAGKSTLVNRLVGSDRVIIHEQPGTTRDSIEIPFTHAGRDYLAIDTAGMRRRARVDDAVERLGAIKSLQAIDGCDVVVMIIDGVAGPTDQDATLLSHVLAAGRALVITINKWDAIEPARRRVVEDAARRRFGFSDFSRIRAISAQIGFGVDQLMAAVDEAWSCATHRVPTPQLTRVLADAVTRTPPPIVRGRRIKLRYAHQGGIAPPVIVIHGNQTDSVPAHYRRYLLACFRRALALVGTPLRLEFRTGENPFRSKRNTLTPRQMRRRRRMIRRRR